MDVSENSGTPQIIHFNRVFHYKPSIFWYHYFWKHPYTHTSPIDWSFDYAQLVFEGQEPEGNARLLREIELNSDYCAMAKLPRLFGLETS